MTLAVNCWSINEPTNAPRWPASGPAARPTRAAALSYVRSMMSSLRAGMPGKEGSYVQRAEHQRADGSAQLSTTGHSPARDIINLRMAEQELHRPQAGAAIDQCRLG